MEASGRAQMKRITVYVCIFTVTCLTISIIYIFQDSKGLRENDNFDGIDESEDDKIIQRMLQLHTSEDIRAERAPRVKRKSKLSTFREMGWSLSPADALEVFNAYYKCVMEREATETGKLDITAVLSLEGQNIELKCPLCLRPDQDSGRLDIQWQHMSSRDSAMRYVDENYKFKFTDEMSLIISGVDIVDAGQFFCVRMRDREIERVYQLDVLFRERRKVIKGSERQNILPEKTLEENNLKLFTLWSDWTDCNRCGKMGQRRKVGLCMVDKINSTKPVEPVDLPILELYPRGIPCRSTVLPSEIAKLRPIRRRQSETIMEYCLLTCPTVAPARIVTDKNGEVIEVIQPGFYSMKERPPLPPMVKRKVLFEDTRKSVILKCPVKPGQTSLIRWQNGTVNINPLTIRRQTRGRVRTDSANRLHIRALRLYDSAPYNCWVKRRLVATIKLIVSEAMNENIKDYITYAGLGLTIFSVTLVCCCVFSGRNKKTIK
ncbi:Ig-like V-type domain-containing protein FAM187A [Argopecten irradians]|uniref:Ig-like V-type domain-containing protein FAM187A n=1 Tax=Argopecten irradians TaxID=31199 RepID=UPI00372269AB